MAVNFSKLLFFLPQIRRIVWEPFWWVILMAIVLWVPFLRVWWWIFAPVFLSIELSILYLWWVRWDYAFSKVQWVTLEVVTPKEILTPLKAMEDVFNTIWTVLYAPSNWREIWFEGAFDPLMSFEIAS